MINWMTSLGDNIIFFFCSVGELVLSSGAPIGSAEIGLLSCVGVKEVTHL